MLGGNCKLLTRQVAPLYTQFESVALKNSCLDTNGGTPLLDVYSCVDPHASNAANELFNISSGIRYVILAIPATSYLALLGKARLPLSDGSICI